jgi:beta-glucosidase-like glycosyl hydrolase
MNIDYGVTAALSNIAGEDPVLTGKLVAQAIRGLQDQHVIGDIKHYALNDQETGRTMGMY